MNKNIIKNIKSQLLPSCELIDITKAAIKAKQTKKKEFSKFYGYSAVAASFALVITIFTVAYALKNSTLNGNNLTKSSNGNQTAEIYFNEKLGINPGNYINIYGDYLMYDKNSIFNESDVIVIGKVEKIKGTMEYLPKIQLDETLSEEEKQKVLNEINAKPLIYTVSTIRVDKVLKGNLQEGEVIEIKQLGGKTNSREVISDVEFFKEGSNKVFFLKDFRKDFGNDMPFSTVNPIQGDIEIVDSILKNKEILKKERHLKIAKDDESLESFIDSIKQNLIKDNLLQSE
jgi:hypothetical protein